MNQFDRFAQHYCEVDGLGIGIDISRMSFPDDYLASMQPRMEVAFAAMRELENGAIANPDESRMVGHYWLRDPDRAPTKELQEAILGDLRDVRDFVRRVHEGLVMPERGGYFRRVLLIGIGGSALGPQLFADALGTPGSDKMAIHFFDNTDPAGMQRELQRIGNALTETLCVVISKSGGTPETRNGMLVARKAYQQAGLDFGKHAIAVTGRDSQLDKYAIDNGFLARFPMYDWVGGRTSIWSAVGMVPGMLQRGDEFVAFLEGAALMDQATRSSDTSRNPAALLALMWHFGTGGVGAKDMVVLPYADRLLIFSRYLQQLIMESLGKEKDLDGNVVNQGISVYGNKGSTDQHAYVQQLRDGVRNFFACFVEVLDKGGHGRDASHIEVEHGITCGDYLNGFFLGTRRALAEGGRDSITITIPEVTPMHLGGLLALFERAVGFYAALVNINAYHQPGVEAGKKAAAAVLKVQRSIIGVMKAMPDVRKTAREWARVSGLADEEETVFLTLRHMAANGEEVSSEGRGLALTFWYDASKL